jgi:hypothetical protein
MHYAPLLAFVSSITNIFTITNNNVKVRHTNIPISKDDNNIEHSSSINISAMANGKVISNSPGGYLGFYTLGVSSYIKENYDLTDYYFCGASAGAWNSLFFTYKGNDQQYINKVIETVDEVKNPSLYQIQQIVKSTLLSEYDVTDFEMQHLIIGVTSFKSFRRSCDIYTNFSSLEDAIDCCISSSHIPLVTGRILNKYKNIIRCDGGFCKFSYFEDSNFNVSPWMWRNVPKYKILKIIPVPKNLCGIYEGLFKKTSPYARDLYELGRNDAMANKCCLDLYFDKHGTKYIWE